MRRLALAGLLLVVACGNADASAEPSPALVALAAPLADAHDALEGQAVRVDEDPDAALETWPDVDARVRAAIEELPDPDGLGLEPRERSTLVGYTRGLEVAVGAWAEVHAALAAGDTAGAARAADQARDRMRHLEPLRAGVTP